MPAIFQAMINEIFKEELLAGWLKIYLDNIIITSTIHQKDQEQTRYILQKLKNNDLYCNLEKYVFSASKVNYLGLIIEKNQVSMHSTKLEGILKQPTPSIVKQVQFFLKFGNFYWQFIGHYSEITRSLNNLTKKDQSWIWTEKYKEAFQKLKEEFAKEPVLFMPDPSKPFIIESDASKWATWI